MRQTARMARLDADVLWPMCTAVPTLQEGEEELVDITESLHGRIVRHLPADEAAWFAAEAERWNAANPPTEALAHFEQQAAKYDARTKAL